MGLLAPGARFGRPEGIILRYYCYKSTKAIGFYRPVMYLFLLANGMTFTQIAVIESLYGLSTVVGEIPTGYVGDRIGRRNSLVLGTVLITGALVGIGLSNSFLAYCALWVTWSMGYNFRSGSADAWLYDVLSGRFSESAFARIRGRGTAAGLFVGALGSVLGGYLGTVNLAYPFFVAAGVTALGVPVLLSLPESERHETDETLTFRRAVGIARRAVLQRELRSFVLYYYVLFLTVVMFVSLYMQPVTKAVLADAGVAESLVEPLLGWMYAGFGLLSAALSFNTGRIEDVVGIRRWFLALPLVVGGGLAVSFAVPVLVVPVMILARSVRETSTSLARQYVNDNIGSVGRATVISSTTMVTSAVAIPARVLSGAVADAYSALLTLVLAGGILLLGSIAVLATGSPIADETGAVDEAAD